MKDSLLFLNFQMPAPYLHPAGEHIDKLMDRLSEISPSNPQYKAILREVTSQFDDFNNLAPGDPRNAAPGGGAADGKHGSNAKGPKKVLSKARSKFIGYTYKRGADEKLRAPYEYSVGGGGGSNQTDNTTSEGAGTEQVDKLAQGVANIDTSVPPSTDEAKGISTTSSQ